MAVQTEFASWMPATADIDTDCHKDSINFQFGIFWGSENKIYIGQRYQ